MNTLLLNALFAAILLTGQIAHAFVEPTNKSERNRISAELPLKEKTLRPASRTMKASGFFKTDLLADQIKINPQDGSLQVISGLLGSVDLKAHKKIEPQEFINFALKYIDQNSEIFSISSKEVQLNKEALLFDQENQFLKFKVLRNGLIVEDANIDFRFKFGKLIQIVNQSYGKAEVSRAQDLKDLDTAAESFVDTNHLVPQGFSYRVQENHTGYKLIKVAKYLVKKDDKIHSLQIDSVSGKLFELKDTFYHLSGSAKIDVYPRWFTEEIESRPFQQGEISVSSGQVSTNDEGQFEADEGSAPKINDGLKGKFVKVKTVSGSNIQRDAGQIRNQWQIYVDRQDQGDTWLDKDTAQSMIYYHTTAIIKEAKRFIENDWLDTPLVANANLNSTCNAHWDGSTINLYSGSSRCANTGLISDVIYHEWGHGLDANTGGIQDGAFSEGFGDIMSVIMTRDHNLGIGFRLPNYEPVRDLEPDAIYPRDRGQVHQEGKIIGSTFWDLYLALKEKHGDDAAVEILKNYSFKMVIAATTYLDVYDALLVIDDNDGDLNNGTPNKCILNKTFHAHGLAERDPGCILASIEDFNFQGGDGDDTLEPGEQIQLRVVARNTSASPVQGLTGKLSVQDSELVQFDQDTLTWDDIESGTAKESRDHAVMTVDANAQCGMSFTTKLVVSADEREVAATRTFTLGKNTGSEKTFAAGNLPIDIVDNQTVLAPVQIEGDDWQEDTTIHRARLTFHLQHTYIGDLTVKLVSPEGSSVEVFKGSGSDDDVSFDEDITDKIAGKIGAGEWKLAVTDSASRDEGKILSVELTLTPAKFECD